MFRHLLILGATVIAPRHCCFEATAQLTSFFWDLMPLPEKQLVRRSQQVIVLKKGTKSLKYHHMYNYLQLNVFLLFPLKFCLKIHLNWI